MNITVPLLVSETRRPKTSGPLFCVRPLFYQNPIAQDEQLSRATAKLTRELRKLLDNLARHPRHDQLLRWMFCPEIEEDHLKTRVLLDHGTADCRVLVVSFQALGRRIGMIPALPGRWFDIIRGQRMLDRARDILVEHFNAMQKESGKFRVPAEFTSSQRQWVTSVDLSISVEPELEKEENDLMAMLGSARRMTGRAELQKVGRCLDWLYPDELDRPVLRDAEVEELHELLSGKQRRPVLLVGEPQVGKTSVVHECVYRRVNKRRTPHTSRNNFWLLAPQRLIAGMMYVGQWESRVTAIVEESIKQDHILYFDDLLGLYYAGMSRDSDLSVAHVIKPYVERNDFRLLAEITPAGLRAMRERDRGFADLFHILPIRPTTESVTRQILFSVRRQLEGKHRCRFNLDVLPLVLDLANRYLRESAQPGKSAFFYRQLAAKFEGKPIGHQEVLSEIRNRSGLSLQFLDDRNRLRREEVITAISAHVTGQTEALEAIADAVTTAKARLNDPGRPLATFLFLGPTGVGKTQCAKALAEYLFGDETRLLRFDMNEFPDGYAAARLNGTSSDPEGLLTAAVRRQPFSVVLLDEIEKAHPAVFDLLLQVLGEGRLTDALGRTADFGNAIIIMTSNLGARQVGVEFGLRPAGQSDRQSYISAAENFFRPEFINRIDRIVPFERLTRQQIGQIAQRLIGDILHRDGLAHRRSVLAVDPAALEQVVDEGYHPQLGARALKRAIERQLTGPVAAHLAGAAPDAPAVIHLYPASSGIAVRVETLVNAERRPLTPPTIDLADWADVLDRAELMIHRMEQKAAVSQNQPMLKQGELSSAQFRYLAAREYADHIRRFIASIDRLAAAPKETIAFRPPIRAPRRGNKLRALSDGDIRTGLRASADTEAQLHALEPDRQSCGDPQSTENTLEDRLAELIHEVSLLETIATSDPGSDRCLVWMRTPNPTAGEQFKALAAVYEELFLQGYGFAASDLHSHSAAPHGPPAKFATKASKSKRSSQKTSGDQSPAPSGAGEISSPDPSAVREHAIVMEMPGIAIVMAIEQGTHLFIGEHRQVIVVQVTVIPLADADAHAVLRELRARDLAWRTSIQRGAGAPNPFPLTAVVRTYDSANVTVDLRTGMSMRGLPSAVELRKLILAQLSSPRDFSRDPKQ